MDINECYGVAKFPWLVERAIQTNLYIKGYAGSYSVEEISPDGFMFDGKRITIQHGTRLVVEDIPKQEEPDVNNIEETDILNLIVSCKDDFQKSCLKENNTKQPESKVN